MKIADIINALDERRRNVPIEATWSAENKCWFIEARGRLYQSEVLK